MSGRSRRKNDAEFEDDEKHLLYREYLRLIADHRPPVFVMENVKGLLSATLESFLAGLLARAADIATRGEQRAAKG